MNGIQNCVPTSTGNEIGYYTYGMNVAHWQFPIGPESLADLQHAEALEINREDFPNVHIHWEESSRDCDGGHGDYGIYRPDSRYLNDDGSVNVYDFWTSEIKFTVSAFAVDGTLKITGDPYDRFDNRAEWSESTEEGYRHREIYLCIDDCETPRNTVYDEYAQKAGY